MNWTPHRVSLRFTLVLYVILPLVVVITLTSSMLLQTFEERVEERMQEDVQLVARALELPVARALERDREGSLIRALESAIGINRVYGAYVYDLRGETIASAGAVNYAPDRERLSNLAAAEDRQGRYDQVSGRRVYSYFVPLATSGGLSKGLLHITRRERDIRSSVAGLRAQMLLLSSGAILLVVGLVLWGHRGSIGRHLERIRASMREVERGDRRHRAPEEGPRELADLAAALNRMLDSVEDAERKVETSREVQSVLRSKLRQVEKLAALGTLSAGVAHELGTPLSVVQGRAQRLLRQEDLPEVSERALHDICREVRRMEHIVRQLLDFGRKHEPARRRVSAHALVNSAARALEDEAQRRSVNVEVRGEPSSHRIHVDPLRIEQALTNLIRNAIEAAEDGRVRVSTTVDVGRAEFVVEDSGPGVSDKIMPRLFEPFFTTKAVGRGTGLGLAVVHGIVEEHGGTIAVDRSALGGARFSMHIRTKVPEDAVHADSDGRTN